MEGTARWLIVLLYGRSGNVTGIWKFSASSHDRLTEFGFILLLKQQENQTKYRKQFPSRGRQTRGNRWSPRQRIVRVCPSSRPTHGEARRGGQSLAGHWIQQAAVRVQGVTVTCGAGCGEKGATKSPGTYRWLARCRSADIEERSTRSEWPGQLWSSSWDGNDFRSYQPKGKHDDAWGPAETADWRTREVTAARFRKETHVNIKTETLHVTERKTIQRAH